jgi:hypothetical protein
MRSAEELSMKITQDAVLQAAAALAAARLASDPAVREMPLGQLLKLTMIEVMDAVESLETDDPDRQLSVWEKLGQE